MQTAAVIRSAAADASRALFHLSLHHYMAYFANPPNGLRQWIAAADKLRESLAG